MDEEATFPVGYRFLPTEEELIVNYLMKQPSKHALSKAVREIDIYQYTPWILQRLYPAARVKGSYFITPRNKKYAKGHRPNRHAGKGFWKATSNDIPILNEGGESIGAIRKTLVYFKNGGLVPEKTNWIMREFRIGNLRDKKSEQEFVGKVLCMIYELKRKPNGRKGAAKQTDDEDIAYEEDEEDDVVSQVSKLQPEDAASNSNVMVGGGQPAYNQGPYINDTNSSNSDDTEPDNLLSWIDEIPDDMLDPSCFADINLPEMSYSDELTHADKPYSIAGTNNSGVLVASTKEDSPTCEEDRFPIGVRFDPTDEEIILYYLMKQPCSNPLALVVHDVDWDQHDPWTLQNMYPMVRVKERYFITNRTNKEGGRRRSDRKDGVGYWKVVGRDKRILNKDGQSIGGVRRTLFYYQPGDLKTNWTIQEYRVGEPGGKKWRNKKSEDSEMQIFCKMYQNQPKGKVLEVKGNAEQEKNQAYNNNDAYMNQPEFTGGDDTPLRLPAVSDVFYPLQESALLADQNSSYEFPLNHYQNDCLVYQHSYGKLGETEADLSQFINGLMDLPTQTPAYFGGQPLMPFDAGRNNIPGLPSATPFSNLVAGQTETNTMPICSLPVSTYFRENENNDFQRNKEGQAETTFTSVGGIEMMMQDPMPYNAAETANLSQFQNDSMDITAEMLFCGDQPMMPYSAGRADNPAETNVTLWPQSPMNYYGYDYIQQNEEIETLGTYNMAEYDVSELWSLG